MSLYASANALPMTTVVDPTFGLPIGATVQIPIAGGGTIQAPIVPSAYASALTPFSMYMPVVKSDNGYAPVGFAPLAMFWRLSNLKCSLFPGAHRGILSPAGVFQQPH